MINLVMRTGPAKIFLLIWLALVLVGCSQVAIIAGTGAGAAIGAKASQERVIGGAARDAQIRFEINEKWFRHNIDLITHLNLQVFEGRVLISGTVGDVSLQEDAIRIAWQPLAVREVINEIEVRDSRGIQEHMEDKWIATQIRAKILFAKNIFSLNYSIESVGGTVYLLGLAQDQDELNLVQQAARTTAHVKKVVSHILIKGVPRSE